MNAHLVLPATSGLRRIGHRILGTLARLPLALAIATAPPLSAQQIEKDYSKYARPFLFVLPKPLAPNGAPSSSSTYVARLDIAIDGSVQRPVPITPADPSMVAAVNDVAHFWLFYPELTSDCKPAPRTGSIEFDYNEGEGRAWLQLGPLGGAGLADAGREKVTAKSTATVFYPREALLQGTTGTVIVAIKLLSDGTAADHVVYFAAPQSRELKRAALNHARSYTFTLSAPLAQPHLCLLAPYEFRLSQ